LSLISRSIIPAENFYSRLLEYLRRTDLIEDCFFSTLNYDCLFEQAAIRTGFHVDYLLEAARAQLNGTGADWPGHRRTASVVYFTKLHGSATFITEATSTLRAQLSAGDTFVGTLIDASDPFARLTIESTRQRFSIMTQTSPERHDFLGGSQLFQVRRAWKQGIRNARLIVLVGLAPREYDTHIWNSLHDATGDIVYVGSKYDADNWMKCNPRFRWIGPTFEKGFLPLLRRLDAYKGPKVGS
jgi:hypothetical protein